MTPDFYLTLSGNLQALNSALVICAMCWAGSVFGLAAYRFAKAVA